MEEVVRFSNRRMSSFFQVWNCIKDEQIANFRGHSGRVLSVLWSFIDPDIIYSGGEDFTLRKWSIASCKEMLPPGD